MGGISTLLIAVTGESFKIQGYVRCRSSQNVTCIFGVTKEPSGSA